MKIKDIFESRDTHPAFKGFIRPVRPALDVTQLRLERKLVGTHCIEVPLDNDVIGVLQVTYKNAAGGVLGLSEYENGERWLIPQVQGARSKKSYRIASGLKWEAFLAKEVAECASHPNAVVRQILMPPVYLITNINGAASHHIEERYKIVRSTLGMQWSDEDNLWLRDVSS